MANPQHEVGSQKLVRLQYLISIPISLLSKYEEVCCAVVDCGIGVVVEAFPSADEEDVSVVVGDGFGFVVACKVVGVNEDDSRSFPGSVSVVDAMTENELIRY